jgi:hypothetical protein
MWSSTPALGQFLADCFHGIESSFANKASYRRRQPARRWRKGFSFERKNSERRENWHFDPQ